MRIAATQTTPNYWVNARFLTQSLTGMQRYAYNIVRRLPELQLVTPGNARPVYMGLEAERVHVRPHRLPSHLWEQLILPKLVGQDSLLWSPSSIGPLRARRHVLTIADLAFMELPDCYRRSYVTIYRALQPRVARRARKVIAISEFTKQRVQELMHVPAEKIEVVSLGYDEQFQPQTREQIRTARESQGLPERYLLALGAISPRKNFRRLLDAWAQVRTDFPQTELVVVGEGGLFFSGADAMGILPPQTRHLTGISDSLLVPLMAGAAGFVYPSLYEGFGLPIVEAMAVGTPVLTSNMTSMPEVAGEAALYCDPYSRESIAAGLRRLLDDASLRGILTEKGYARAALYQWDDCAAQTRRILQEAAAE